MFCPTRNWSKSTDHACYALSNSLTYFAYNNIGIMYVYSVNFVMYLHGVRNIYYCSM